MKFLFALFCLCSLSFAQTNVSSTDSTTVTETPRRWGAGLTIIADRNARVRSATEDDSAAEVQTETQFALKYKLTADGNNNLAVIQRLLYNQSTTGVIQQEAALGNLRVEYNRKGSLANGDALLLVRGTLPTVLESRRDKHFVGMTSVFPELYWNVTPRLQLGYSGKAEMEFFDDSEEIQGAAATKATFQNSAVANYNLNEKWVLSQWLGIAESRLNDRRDLGHTSRLCQTWELMTGVAYNPTKELSFSLAAYQSAATNDNSVDSKGLKVAYDSNFNLFAKDQTYYELIGSVSY